RRSWARVRARDAPDIVSCDPGERDEQCRGTRRDGVDARAKGEDPRGAKGGGRSLAPQYAAGRSDLARACAAKCEARDGFVSVWPDARSRVGRVHRTVVDTLPRAEGCGWRK